MDEDVAPADLAVWAVQATDDAVVVTDAQGRACYVNPGFTRMFGYTLDDLLGRNPLQVLTGPHTDVIALERAHGLQQPSGYCIELLAYTRMGKPLWVQLMANRIRSADGREHHRVGVLSDITLTKMRAVLQRRVLDAMVHETPLANAMGMVCEEIERIAPQVLCGVLAVDGDGLLHPLAAPSLPQALADALAGRPAAFLVDREGALQQNQLRSAGLAPLLPPDVQSCASWSIRTSDGSLLGVLVLYFRGTATLQDFHRQLVAISVQLCALAVERNYARQIMEDLASFDQLTGLANRFALKVRATQAAAELAQDEASMAVLCIDLDRFKRINESHGTMVGDAVLREVAGRLLRTVRGIDVTGRLDGDGFAAILPSCTLQQAALAARRVQAAIGTPMPLPQGGGTVTVSASVGVAMYPDDGTSIDDLLHHADMALAQAKASGVRGGLRFFNEEMQQRVRERVALEAALRHELRGGGLRLHFQPQVDRRSGALHGVEALARWTHAALGEIPPSRFIPLAEEAGLVNELGRWALAEACQQMGQWREHGVPVPRVGVNLSARNFEDPRLVALVADLLAAHGLQAADLTLEMTESVMLDASSQVMASLHALRAMGVQLSLDDFGTGYSSLSYLHRLPIDELKLDQSFVHDLDDSPTARALTNTILRIGDSLGLTVVAEGVETEAQAQLLAERGSTIVQGHLYGRPMAAAALAGWLRQRAALDQGAAVFGS